MDKDEKGMIDRLMIDIQIDRLYTNRSRQKDRQIKIENHGLYRNKEESYF